MNREHLSHVLQTSLGMILLLGSVWVIHQELQQHSLAEIFAAFQTISGGGVLTAIALTGLNYGVIIGYDALALRSLRVALPCSQIAVTAITSYGISNTVGLALLSGSGVRYRFYSRDLSPLQIGQVIFFCNFSFWLGLLTVAGCVFSEQPVAMPAALKLPFTSIHPLGYGFLAAIAAYIGWNLFGSRTLILGHWRIPHVSLPICLGQLAIASSDWLLSAMVLAVLLPMPTLAFSSFLGIYLLAQISGIVSNVPGGLGVFETVLLVLLPHQDAAGLIGALLAYRCIYYFLPLFVGLLLLGWHELRRKQPSR
jgi:uncharacterized membrane protein YbhN (UPF0104 family)